MKSIAPIMIRIFPNAGEINAAVKSGCKIPIAHSTKIPAQKLAKAFVKSPSKRSQKITISINAVGFAIVAKAKNTAEIIKYFGVSFLDAFVVFSRK